jgi:regulatory protein
MNDSLRRPLAVAFRYLSSRPRSEAELRLRLYRRGFDDGVVSQVVAELKEQSLVDDVAFAQFWRENREAFSPRSRRLVEQELKEKGVAAEVIAQIMTGFDDELEAYRAAKRKTRSPWGDYPCFYKKLSAFLRRRGFDYDVIRRTVDRVWKEVAE